jgi:pyruvate dehydrogenase E2 component (dihydrolipoamide acetyltransferase)
MAETFELPDLGEGLQEAEIIAWHIGVGDHVVTDQPLVSVETDKAVVEVPSPRSGRIAELHGAPGDVVAVGAALVEFAEDTAADKGAIVGTVASVEEKGATPEKARAAPAVRRLAAQLGVELTAVEPTGPGGTVTRADVESAAGEGARSEPIRGVRRAMFHNMTRAGREVVPATVTDEADIDSWPARTDVTVRLIRAVAVGCRESPSLNAWFDAETMTRRVHERIDLGIAVETGDGLFAPVMRDIGNRDAVDLRRGVEAMKQDISARSIPHEQLVGQTITLSNFGMFGGRFADLIVVPPQVAILGAGQAGMRIVAVDGAPAAHRLLPLSLSFDHRVVTGVEAARFLNAVIADLQHPD